MSRRRSISGEQTEAANASVRRRSRRGKEIAEDSTEVEDVKESLPGRLFATDRFPSERVNTYSTTDFLLCVRDLLKGSVEMGQILGSCFGRLFSLPVRRMLAGKVVHGMLTRQVVTKKKYELWPVFGGKPFRFSLVEFGEVTGKLRLCLIIIVDGVLVPNAQKPKPSLKHVNLVKNLKKFFAFQWGRESFLAAIRTMLPGPKVMGKCEDPNGDFCKKLRQKTVRLLGFPQALQLVAFEAIPRLLVQAGGDDSVTLMNFPGTFLPQDSGLNVCDLREAEHDPALIVQPMMEISGVHEERWGVWDDEKYDKKRRLSGYFKREIVVDGEEHARMVSRVEELGTEVLRLKEVVEKQGRQFLKWKTFMKGKSAAKKFGSVRRRDKRKTDGGPRDGTEDFYSDGGGAGYPKEQMSGEIGEDDFSPEQGARTSSEERPSLLVRMKEGDGVPLQWVEPESGDNILYRALTSQTFFVSEEEGSSVDGGRRDDGGQGDGLDEKVLTCGHTIVNVQNGKAMETEGREEKEEGGGGSKVCVDDPNTDLEGSNNEEGKIRETEGGVCDEKQEEEPREEGKASGTVCGRPEENQEEDARKTEERKLGETEDGGRDENQEEDARKTEVDVLDGSVEQEGELAALLLAKDQYVVPEIIPLVEDPDYAFFERVLMAHSKVLHINARGYDLDNEFFIDLGTPCKWVTSTHMDVMMEYVGSLHAETLRQSRAMFVAPWFSAHLQGKGRSFRAARRKTLIAADSRVTKFLTTEGKQWGVDVDTLYAPMIWDGDHWVGLCIRLTTWDVLVLDPRPGYKSVEEVATLMAPVVEMLPYLAKKVCPADAVGEHQLVPFHVERVAGLYENRRSGDCGPVAAKFMEIHATGDGIARMAALNDDLVSIFRKQYAMEIYKDWVLPLYM
uniref:Ubiquitin-like protease family profile domain-containing protein n=2 Tax=Brassica campestris TaxID=3711 RepID=A0A3P6AS55_BRACM|nr:unnamed protein product [Brassica rapa]